MSRLDSPTCSLESACHRKREREGIPCRSFSYPPLSLPPFFTNHSVLKDFQCSNQFTVCFVLNFFRAFSCSAMGRSWKVPGCHDKFVLEKFATIETH